MCAICGQAVRGGRADPGPIRRMMEAMRHRGPDDEGFYADDTVVLGHRRLTIIDPATGRQPIANEDDSVRVVCNGEIYNFEGLRKDLEASGHRFRTRSDTETIVHLYEERGIECVSLLRGPFAFALWDSRLGRLFLARDRVGKKPLFYAGGAGGSMAFASEVSALLLHPAVGREIDPGAVDLFLSWQGVPAPLSIFRGVRKLPPAHWLKWENGSVEIRRYWDLDFSKKTPPGPEDEYAERFWSVLEESVRLRMVADVPLGAFLSGGIDSSTVVGMMSGLSSRPVRTFSIGFDERDFSELRFARSVAERFGTEHREFVVRPDVMGVLPELVRRYGEPFGDSSMVPSFHVARETRRHVTVALNGDGGDESLAGYPRYAQTAALERALIAWRTVPGSVRRPLDSAARRLGRGPGAPVGLRALRWLGEADAEGLGRAYAAKLFSFDAAAKADLYTDWMKGETAGCDAAGAVARTWEDAGPVETLDRMLYTDFRHSLPDVLLVKMDVATMANGLEGRSPFLDHVLIETAAALPPGMKLRGNVSKYILRKKLRGFLPEEILRRRKMGFGLPIGGWFRNELRRDLEETLLGGRAAARPYFRPDAVRRLVAEHVAGRVSHTHRLWNLLVFEIWNRIFADGGDGA